MVIPSTIEWKYDAMPLTGFDVEEIRKTDKEAFFIPNVTFTHVIAFYGGYTLKVAIISDRTNMDLGFRFGMMRVVADELNMFGDNARTIDFGVYNAIRIMEL